MAMKPTCNDFGTATVGKITGIKLPVDGEQETVTDEDIETMLKVARDKDAAAGRLKRKPKAVNTAPLEKDIQKAIVEYLRLVGAVAIRVNSGAISGEHNGKKRFVRFNSEPGCSDIIACLAGRFVAIEVKRPGKKATDAQTSFLDSVRQAGGVAFVADSVEVTQISLRAEGLIS